MRVLLISLNTLEDPFAVFPLGLAYLRDAVAAAGHEVAIFDCLLDGSGEALDHRIGEFAPEVIGLSLRNIDDVRADRATSYVTGLRVQVERIRARSNATLVLGGAGYSIFPLELLAASGADYGVCGEGEAVFPRLLDLLGRNPAALEAVPGLVYRDRRDGAARANPPARGVCTPTQFAPPADWVARYRERGALFNIQSQRGCPLQCSYCTYPQIEGSRRRLHDYAWVVAQMRHWYDCGVRYAFVTDSVLNTSARHLRDVARALIDAGVDMQWGCFLRPNALRADDMQLLVDAGLRHIEFGCDSFADAMLASYRKSFGFEAIEQASALAQRAGVHYSHFLILGGPGESERTLQQTVERSATLPGGVFFAFPGVRVYPNTRLAAELRARGRPLPESLLEPHFFIEDGLTLAGLTERLQSWNRRDPRWAPLTLPDGFDALSRRLRARGVEGPLWEYLPWLAGVPQAPVAAAASE